MARQFEWSDLKIFIHVAEAGSISGASKTLNMAQPGISTRIRKLEDDLKCLLFLRTAKGVSLTDRGRQILEYAQEAERAANAVDRLARESDAKEEGGVRIAAPDGMSAFWLAPRLGDFMRLHPLIELSLDSGLWPQDPVREELDVALEFEKSAIGDYRSSEIATVHYAYFASERYTSIYGAPKTLEEIGTHRTIHHSAQKQQKETWDPALPGVQATANLVTNCSATVVMAVYAGAGIGLMPTAVASFLPGLVMLGEQPVAQPKLYLNYHMDIAKITRVRLVIDWLKEIYDPKQNPWYRDQFVHPRAFGAAQGPLHLPPLS